MIRHIIYGLAAGYQGWSTRPTCPPTEYGLVERQDGYAQRRKLAMISSFLNGNGRVAHSLYPWPRGYPVSWLPIPIPIPASIVHLVWTSYRVRDADTRRRGYDTTYSAPALAANTRWAIYISREKLPPEAKSRAHLNVPTNHTPREQPHASKD